MKIYKYIHSLFSEKPLWTLPSDAQQIGDYRVNFEQARSFTVSCGFDVDNISWIPDEVLDNDGEFVDKALQIAGIHSVKESAIQCLKWCHYLAPAFEQQLGRKVWVTIGQLWKGDAVVFSPSWDELKRWSQRGITLQDIQNSGKQGINLHAWLTVESGEIIEITLLSSLSLLGGKYAEFSGAIVWGKDPGVLQNHRYFPMAIGRAFAEAVGGKSNLPLLARKPQELYQKFGVLTLER